MFTHLPGDTTIDLKETPNGLFCHDIHHHIINNSESVNDYSFVTTVEANIFLH